MSEEELAEQMINQALAARAIEGFAFTTIACDEFGLGKYDLETFKECLAKYGFKLIPIEESHLRNTPIKNKYVVIGR